MFGVLFVFVGFGLSWEIVVIGWWCVFFCLGCLGCVVLFIWLIGSCLCLVVFVVVIMGFLFL